MNNGVELHKFPKNSPRCSQCSAKRWYSENGLRFCQNGHQIEGYIEFAADEDGAAGLTNHHVARKEKEERIHEKQRLTGSKGRDLYLEFLQYLLHSQVLWLINEKAHKQELDDVVRDLWDLRIRGCPPAENDGDGEQEEIFFSSSQPTQLQEELHVQSIPRSRLIWTVTPGLRWTVPSPLETLAICYMGCLLLRIPTKICDIYTWAKIGQLPFVNAMEILPKDLSERLPQPYPRMLRAAARTPMQGNDLYSTVNDMCLAYHMNYGMVTPPVNHHIMALSLVKALFLPIEVMIIFKHLCSILTTPHSLPVTKSRIMLIDQPEIHLIALIVVIVKHFFPFSGPSGIESRPDTLPKIDWSTWEKYSKTIEEPQAEINDYRNISGDQLVSMSDEQQEKLLHQITSISMQNKESNSRLLSFFPFESPGKKDTQSTKTGKSDGVLAEVYEKAISYGANVDNKSSSYVSVSDRDIFDLSADAKVFYEKVSKVTGLDNETLIRAVDMVETQIQAVEKGHR